MNKMNERNCIEPLSNMIIEKAGDGNIIFLVIPQKWFINDIRKSKTEKNFLRR